MWVTMRKREVDAMIRRTRDLIAVAGEHSRAKPMGIVVALICNGCGKQEFVSASTRGSLEESLPYVIEGWEITSDPKDEDLCPDCVKKPKRKAA